MDHQSWVECNVCGAPRCCGHGLGPTRLHYLQAIIRGDAPNPYLSEPEIPCCKGTAWGCHTSSCVLVSQTMSTVKNLQDHGGMTLEEAATLVCQHGELTYGEQAELKRRLKI